MSLYIAWVWEECLIFFIFCFMFHIVPVCHFCYCCLFFSIFLLSKCIFLYLSCSNSERKIMIIIFFINLPSLACLLFKTLKQHLQSVSNVYYLECYICLLFSIWSVSCTEGTAQKTFLSERKQNTLFTRQTVINAATIRRTGTTWRLIRSAGSSTSPTQTPGGSTGQGLWAAPRSFRRTRRWWPEPENTVCPLMRTTAGMEAKLRRPPWPDPKVAPPPDEDVLYGWGSCSSSCW